jgi:hypothetical protein
MYTFSRPCTGAVGAFSRRSRASSTPPWLAVEVLSLADPNALLAHAARLGGRTLLAVDHLRQDPRGRRLAGPARATEQERVRETALAHRAHQRADDVLLAEDLTGALRPVLPVEGLVLLSHAHLREPREA